MVSKVAKMLKKKVWSVKKHLKIYGYTYFIIENSIINLDQISEEVTLPNVKDTLSSFLKANIINLLAA